MSRTRRERHELRPSVRRMERDVEMSGRVFWLASFLSFGPTPGYRPPPGWPPAQIKGRARAYDRLCRALTVAIGKERP